MTNKEVILKYHERLYEELRMYGPKDLFNKSRFLLVADEICDELLVEVQE